MNRRNYDRATKLHYYTELKNEHPDWPAPRLLRMCGISKPTLHRWMKQLKRDVPPTPKKTGRPPKFPELHGAEFTALRALVVKHEGSIEFAVPEFITDPACSPGLAAIIQKEIETAAVKRRKPDWPGSLRRQIRATDAELAHFRGQRHAGNVSLAPRIGLFHRDEQGRDHYIKANSVWIADDETSNQRYLVPIRVHPDIIDRVDPKYHWKLCGQLFKFQDFYSARWLSVTTIGRERDAYRGEDIPRFILQTIDAMGTMPEELLFEKGRWMGTAVHGIPVWNGRKEIMWGGLDPLMKITHASDSRGKAWIETGFSFSQRACAQGGEDIGRSRGEFENATEHYLQIQRQAAMLEEGRIPDVLRDPIALGFLTASQCEELHSNAMWKVNCLPKVREGFEGAVVPNDLYEHTIPPRPLPVSERWRFLPHKAQRVITGGGKITVSIKPYGKFQFIVNGVIKKKDGSGDIHLDNGHRALIAFDPQRPDLGCVVGNMEMGSMNREGYGFGEIMGTAEHLAPVPYRDDSADYSRPNYKKRATAAVRNGFAAVKQHLKDERAARIVQTLDEQGRFTRAGNRPDVPLIESSPHTPCEEPDAPDPRTRRVRSTLDLDPEAIAARERRAMEREIFA